MLFYKLFDLKLVFANLFLFSASFLPLSANAGLLFFKAGTANAKVEHSSQNSQTMTLLQASDMPKLGKGGPDISNEGDALVADSGPEDIASENTKNEPSDDAVSVYIVKKGDTVSSIAKAFKASETAIVSANDLKRGKPLTEGQNLVILRIPGAFYKVKKGDTLGAISKKFKVDSDEIISVNGFDNANSIVAGDEIIIPGIDGGNAALGDKKIEEKKIAQKEKPKPVASTKAESPVETEEKPAVVTKTEQAPTQSSSYFIRPINGGRKSQGLHDDNAIDLAAPIGTPIMTSADGEVVVARGSGYNGGYGQYVVIAHDYNGKKIQTLYAHMSKVASTAGNQVKQGDIIGYVGSTGKSTGPHVHFSVRGGAKNPNWD